MKQLIVRATLSICATVFVAFVATLVATLTDLYLVGHGYPSINREVLVWPAAGVRLSPAGIFLLLSALAAGCTTWFLLRRSDHDASPGRR